nr:2Fe-2S iron-sulfur cluster-binding protein [uncultured Albidiferax sp.]
MPSEAPRYKVSLFPEAEHFDAPPDLPVLVSAEHAGLLLASSCRNGSCRSCICRMLSGRVRYQIAWPGLSADEKAEGYILPCVAYPMSDMVVQLPPRAGYTV